MMGISCMESRWLYLASHTCRQHTFRHVWPRAGHVDKVLRVLCSPQAAWLHAVGSVDLLMLTCVTSDNTHGRMWTEDVLVRPQA